MQDKRLTSLPLSKEVLDRTPQEEIDLLLRLLLRVDESDSLWTFLHEPGVAATNNHAEGLLRFPVIWRKRGFGMLFTLSLSLSLSLLNSTYLLLRKQSWQHSARAAFCLFPGRAAGLGFSARRECDALGTIT